MQDFSFVIVPHLKEAFLIVLQTVTVKDLPADRLIRSGNDFCLAPNPLPESIVDDQESATSVLAMRKACKNILYTTVNSRAYAGEVNGGLPAWEMRLRVISGIILALAAVCEILLVRSYRKKK